MNTEESCKCWYRYKLWCEQCRVHHWMVKLRFEAPAKIDSDPDLYWTQREAVLSEKKTTHTCLTEQNEKIRQAG